MDKDIENALNSAKLLSQARIGEQEKPVQLVANGKGSLLYAQKSAWGRIWSVLHWICGTGDTALAKVIRATAGRLQQVSQERQKLCQMVESEGVLGDFWKQYTVVEMQSKIQKHVKISTDFQPNTAELENFMTTVRWADQQLKSLPEDKLNEDALRVFEGSGSLESIAIIATKVETAQAFDHRWIELGGSDIAALGTVFRELVSDYPDNNEELLQKRDNLQEKAGFCLGGEGRGWNKAKCPASLLFGPLVKIAYQIGLQKNHDLTDYSELFDALTAGVSNEKQRSMQKTASKIISLASYFRETQKPEKIVNIPDVILTNLSNANYLSKIGLYTTDATTESDCCRVGGGTRTKVISIPSVTSYHGAYHSHALGAYHHHGFGSYSSPNYIVVEENLPVQHRRDYYRYHKAQDGTESLSTFYTLSPTAG